MQIVFLIEILLKTKYNDTHAYFHSLGNIPFEKDNTDLPYIFQLFCAMNVY